MRTPDVRAARHAERVSGDKATKVKRGASAWFHGKKASALSAEASKFLAEMRRRGLRTGSL